MLKCLHSNVLEIPNLRQKANTILQRLAARWCLGIKQQDDPFLPQRKLGLFALYAVASSLYGWIVTASILSRMVLHIACAATISSAGHSVGTGGGLASRWRI